MNPLGITVLLVVLVGVWAQINVLRPECDSLEVEEAALVAQDYLNAQHKHGYKYVLNKIEDIKILTTPTGDETYDLEIDLLETECHVLDPTPLANCTVRPKKLTAVEGDCEFVLKKAAGVLSVTAFKCKTEESTEDLCLGCPSLLPLNDTLGLDFVKSSLVTVNNSTVNVTYAILEVGRMSSQVVASGPMFLAEYVIAEANCTDDDCTPLNDAMAMPVVDANSTAAAEPVVQLHVGSPSPKHGLRYHRLTTIHNPELSDLLSAESAESAEVVPVVIPEVPVVILVPAAEVPVVIPVPAAEVPDAPDVHATQAQSPAATNAAPVAADPTAAEPVTAAADPAAADPEPAVVPDPAQESPMSKEMHLPFKRDLTAVSGAAANIDPVAIMPVCPGRVRFF